LVGAAGAAVASVGGRLGDRGLDPLTRAEPLVLVPGAMVRVFMNVAFVSGASASAVTGVIHTAYGWTGVMTFTACSPMLGLLMWGRQYLVCRRIGNALLHAELDATRVEKS
jgi:hypothetical protein